MRWLDSAFKAASSRRTPKVFHLLDQQLKALEADFLEEDGFSERLYHSRWKK